MTDVLNTPPAASAAPRLHQVNASYDPVEDRIRFATTTSVGQEFRFWITRRYLGLLWQALNHITAQFAQQRAPDDPLLRSALSGFAEAKAMNNADMATPYADGTDFPLGEEPLLLSNITISPGPSGQQYLRLTPERGQGIDLALNEELTHVIANLLLQAAVAAQWGLELDSAQTPSGLSGTAVPHRLH